MLRTAVTTAAAPAGAPDVQRVRAAIAQLSPAERDLLVLRFRDDLDVARIAARLRTAPSMVERRLHRAGWVVQDVAGVTPMQWGEAEPRLLRGRPSHLVEEEAAAGITPLLAARLVAALAGGPPAGDPHWRLHAVLRGVRSHGDGALMTLLLLGAAMPVVLSLASL